MSLEIERKFLVKNDFKKEVSNSYKIKQGFLSTVPERTVRIRQVKDKAYLTVKGKSNKIGTTRLEWEKEISTVDAEMLFPLCEPIIIEKIRHLVPVKDNLCFEIDEFLGQNKGLVVAEIELPSENTFFEKPIWLGKEVTGEKKYYNSMLSKKPFLLW